MSTDSGSPILPRSAVAPTLPRILGLRIRRVPYAAPKLKHFRSSLARLKQAVEFVVETEAPIPVRAYGPALFVGNVEINHSERLTDTTWRLLAFEVKKLKPGAPITWGWMKDPESARQHTEFRYAIEGAGSSSR